MPENENEIENSAAKHDEAEAPWEASDGVGGVEEQQAEEFADEMHAEPKDIDGEPGVASVEEEAAAEALSAGAAEVPIVERLAEERAAEVHAEPKNVDSEPGVASEKRKRLELKNGRLKSMLTRRMPSRRISRANRGLPA